MVEGYGRGRSGMDVAASAGTGAAIDGLAGQFWICARQRAGPARDLSRAGAGDWERVRRNREFRAVRGSYRCGAAAMADAGSRPGIGRRRLAGGRLRRPDGVWARELRVRICRARGIVIRGIGSRSPGGDVWQPAGDPWRLGRRCESGIPVFAGTSGIRERARRRVRGLRRRRSGARPMARNFGGGSGFGFGNGYRGGSARGFFGRGWSGGSSHSVAGSMDLGAAGTLRGDSRAGRILAAAIPAAATSAATVGVDILAGAGIATAGVADMVAEGIIADRSLIPVCPAESSLRSPEIGTA